MLAIGLITIASLVTAPSMATADPNQAEPQSSIGGCSNAVIDESGPGSRAKLSCSNLPYATEFRTVGECGSGAIVYGSWKPDNGSTSTTSRCYTGFNAVYYQKR